MDLTVEEVAESLTLGDHRNLNRLTLRGALGLGVIASGMLRAPSPLRLGAPQVLHVIASAVAHGERLTNAVSESLDGLGVAIVADARFVGESVAVDIDVPGLSPKSMRSRVNRRNVLDALRLRRRAEASIIRSLSASRLYAEYLFFAQAVRYAEARDAIAAVDTVMLLLTDFDRHAYTRPWVWAANQHGVSTATMVHGSPNQNYIPVLADTALVWGEVQAEWFAKHSPGTKVEIVGRPDVKGEPLPVRTVKMPTFITMEDIHRMVAD